MPRAKTKSLPSVERLNELFVYDKDTGRLHWQVDGRVAGGIGSHGYIVIGISNNTYLAHRVIWKLVTGSDPTDELDHIDGDKKNNRWCNLRSASKALNMRNRAAFKNSKSGIKGVYFHIRRQAWTASIQVEGKRISLGYFKERDDAASARQSASEKYHGAFMRAA